MSVRLFVLGVLYDTDAHGYHIKEIARASNLDNWSDVAYGSIYHALSAMEKEELIEQASTEREGHRPPRTLYRITEKGRVAFMAMLRETSTFGYHEKHPINLALPFMTHLSPEERVARLEERVQRLEARRNIVLQRREALHFLEASAPWVIATLEQDLGHLEFEIAWTRKLQNQVREWSHQPKHTHL